jgi:hypothetical protein
MYLQNSIERLQKHISEIPQLLKDLNDAELKKAPAGKWSKKEEFGHLIDSAINNSYRFVTAQFSEKPYNIMDYEGTRWVAANNYQQRAFEEMLSLWRALNIHIIRILQNITPEQLSYRCIEPEGTEVDLDYIIKDYVDHMDHHFNHIFHVAD